MNAVREKMVQYLKASTPLTGALGEYMGSPAVFDGAIPDGAPARYVVLDEPTANSAGRGETKTTRGRRYEVDVIVRFPETGDRLPVAAAAEIVRGLFHKQEAALQALGIPCFLVRCEGPYCTEEEETREQAVSVLLELTE